MTQHDAATTATSFDLTEWTTCGGCAAKWGAGPLDLLLATLASRPGDGSLLVGLDSFDDAAVLALTEDLALVSTTDFFPPMVADPADYGAIAAANACSDVFAMGGSVVLALNIAAFPEHLPHEVIDAIVSSAAAVVAEAGGVVAGGHTIRSQEPIFGLAVQGLVHPARILTKRAAHPGQAVVLSKRLGTGIVLQDGTDEERRATVAGMRRLNKEASSTLQALGAAVGAVTDVTGFGLLGHGWEVAERSGVSLVLEADRLPLYPGALDAARRGVRTGGDRRNRDHLEGRVRSSVTAAREALAFDPQTSGGLLATVDRDVLAELTGRGFVAIGTVEAGPAEVLLT
ncbi:MAG: selenide, water dikinase SelD [Actinomycetota bacterium]|jgi:selenide,water dikinase|nr:selenide, water dikinase SelD [Actinomycetota bacterium]